MNELDQIARYQDGIAPGEVDATLKRVDEWVLKIIADHHSLRLIGAQAASTLADDLWESINNEGLIDNAKMLRAYRLDQDLGTTEEREAAATQFNNLWKHVSETHNKFTEAVEDELARMSKPRTQTS